MNLRTLLTLGLWAIIAWLLFRACSPKQDTPEEVNTDYRPEIFSVADEEARTVVLENDLVWSLWSTEGAGCLEIKLKNFTPSKVTDHEPDETDWLVMFRAQRGMPKAEGAPDSPLYYRKRLGLRMVEAERQLGTSLDAAVWELEQVKADTLQFRLQTENGVSLLKQVTLPTTRYHFDVKVSAQAETEQMTGKDLLLRLGTGGGIVREPDTFYPNPYVAVGQMQSGVVDDFEQFFPKGSLPGNQRRDAAARWHGQLAYVVEGSKYFLSALRPLDTPFVGAVAETLYDDSVRVDDILSGLDEETKNRYHMVGRNVANLQSELGREPELSELVSATGLDIDELRTVLVDRVARENFVTLRDGAWFNGPYWKRSSISGDFNLHISRPADPAAQARFQWYVGPKDTSILADYGDLKTIPKYADYGSSFFYKMFLTTWIAPTIMALLNIFHSIAGNWGVAIILLTVLVRGSLMPLNRRSQLKMAEYQVKMQKVKPLIEKINKKHGKDPKKKQEETMKLYKQHSVTPPLGGCLPILLQMPIFIGLFAALRSATDLRQQPFFGWIEDLSRPDALIELGGPVASFFPLSAVTSFNLLPVIMVVLWVAHQKSMPKPADPNAAQMQKIMTFMPILFGVMLYNYAAGLSLYMITSSLIGIFEAKVIKKKWPVGSPPSDAVTG
jgi:YidC/Oxa1 family membrane protein insertase